MPDIKIPWPEWKAVRKIGNGSFGSVYEIERQDGFGHTEKAALKVISIPKEESEIDSLMANGYDANSITEYFRTSLNNIMNEYAMMAALKGHSNIVSCEDRTAVKQANGIGWDVYIRMELLTPFTKIIKEKEISVEETVKIGKCLLKAISACHEKKIIHRDIKPENIFVTDYGEYKLGDFGVARIMSHTTNATKTGTPYYMAPEVDNNEKYGKEADIYSLGMVLYWLLNNRRLPFEPTDHPPLPSEKEKAYKTRLSGKEVPEPLNGSSELKKVIRKAISYKPKNRYRTAEEMLSAIENIQNITGTESKPKTNLDFKNIIGKVTRPENNKKEISYSKQSAEHVDYSKTNGNSWETSDGTIGSTGNLSKKEVIEAEDTIGKTVGPQTNLPSKSQTVDERTVLPKKTVTNNQKSKGNSKPVRVSTVSDVPYPIPTAAVTDGYLIQSREQLKFTADIDGNSVSLYSPIDGQLVYTSSDLYFRIVNSYGIELGISTIIKSTISRHKTENWYEKQDRKKIVFHRSDKTFVETGDLIATIWLNDANYDVETTVFLINNNDKTTLTVTAPITPVKVRKGMIIGAINVSQNDKSIKSGQTDVYSSGPEQKVENHKINISGQTDTVLDNRVLRRICLPLWVIVQILLFNANVDDSGSWGLMEILFVFMPCIFISAGLISSFSKKKEGVIYKFAYSAESVGVLLMTIFLVIILGELLSYIGWLQ